MELDRPLQEWSDEERSRIFPILLRAYDPHWPALYEAEATEISRALGLAALRIRHIGSTAVPGLLAKPTIDILLEIPNDADLGLLRAGMEGLGYLYNPQPDNPPPHAVFLKGYTPRGFEGQCFHVHARYPGDHDEPYFCAYLRAHPEAAAEYAALKPALQRRFEHDRDAYTRGKTQFVRRITALARAQGKQI